MKNTISDLRNHMFAALERLNDESAMSVLLPDELKVEIDKAKAIAMVGKVAVETFKTELLSKRLEYNPQKSRVALLDQLTTTDDNK